MCVLPPHRPRAFVPSRPASIHAALTPTKLSLCIPTNLEVEETVLPSPGPVFFNRPLLLKLFSTTSNLIKRCFYSQPSIQSKALFSSTVAAVNQCYSQPLLSPIGVLTQPNETIKPMGSSNRPSFINRCSHQPMISSTNVTNCCSHQPTISSTNVTKLLLSSTSVSNQPLLSSAGALAQPMTIAPTAALISSLQYPHQRFLSPTNDLHHQWLFSSTARSSHKKPVLSNQPLSPLTLKIFNWRLTHPSVLVQSGGDVLRGNVRFPAFCNVRVDQEVPDGKRGGGGETRKIF